MKVQTTIEKISSAVQKVQKVSSKNVSLPILENVLLIADENTLTFRSTNLHVGVEVLIPVKVQEPGVLAVNLKIFSDIILNSKNEHTINLHHENQVLEISTDHTQMSIKTFEHDDFPTLPRVEDQEGFTIPLEQFIEGVRSVMGSASHSEIKPEIASVYIYQNEGNLVFVATDSFRLSEKKIKIKGIEDFPGVIIPIKNIIECVRVFQGDSGNIDIYINPNQICIQSHDTYFTSRVVDGTYPDYQQIIPKETNTEFILLKDELGQTLRLVNVFSNTFNQVSLSSSAKDGSITISSRNTDIGENTSSVDAVVNGDDVELHLNHRYITDALGVIASDSINFSILEKNKPMVLRGVNQADFLYLIMPMNR